MLVHLDKLITNTVNELREENLSLDLKTTISDHIVKVGIIIDLNLRFLLKQNYKASIYNKIVLNERVIELKKILYLKKTINKSVLLF